MRGIGGSHPASQPQPRPGALQTRHVLVYTFKAILTLAHPTMPFVTEAMWAALPRVPGAEDALISARWPRAAERGGAQPAAEDGFSALQAAVRAVRNSRAEYGVEPGRRIPAAFLVADPGLRAALASEAATIALLARLDPGQVCCECCSAVPRGLLPFCMSAQATWPPPAMRTRLWVPHDQSLNPPPSLLLPPQIPTTSYSCNLWSSV